MFTVSVELQLYQIVVFYFLLRCKADPDANEQMGAFPFCSAVYECEQIFLGCVTESGGLTTMPFPFSAL